MGARRQVSLAKLAALLESDDPLHRCIAATAARYVEEGDDALLDRLGGLFQDEDPWVIRAAATSYIRLHPEGTSAPALTALSDHPNAGVRAAARGADADPNKLEALIRSALRCGTKDAEQESVELWHGVLWRLHPTPRAPASPPQVEALIAALERNFVPLLDRLAPTAREDRLLFYYDDLNTLLEVIAFKGERERRRRSATVALPVLDALRRSDGEPEDGPWAWFYQVGVYAICVGLALTRISRATLLHEATEIRLATCLGCSGEIVPIGIARASGLVFCTAAEEAAMAG